MKHPRIPLGKLNASSACYLYIPLALLCLNVFVPTAYAEEDGLDMEEVQALVDQVTPELIQQLEAGEVITNSTAQDSDSGYRAARGTVFMLYDHTPEEIWPYLSDHNSYHEFMPHLLSVESYELKDGGLGITQKLKIAWKTLEYNLVQIYDKENNILHWHLDRDKENDVQQSRGYWKLIPHNEKQTIVIYMVDVDSGMRVPRFIEDFMLKRDLPGVVTAMKQRVETKGEYKK